MTLIIAEAGVNHNGSRKLALKLVEAASEAGADIVKFQTFKAKKLVTENAKQAAYQSKNTKKCESQLAMLSHLELSYEDHHLLLEKCNRLNIEFLSTAFDRESLDFLVSDLGVKRLKIPSGEITNAPLVLEHAKTGKDIILSTGMASLSEIEAALSVIAFGYLGIDGVPSQQKFIEAYSSSKGQNLLRNKVTVLHCTTEYPAPMEEINLRAMNGIKSAFGLPVGYSDHSEGIAIPIAAATLGANIIEKHFTLDKNFDGPDHKASMNPKELRDMIYAVRRVCKALGNGVKIPTDSEVANKDVARKSLVATTNIGVGEIFTEINVGIKRPGNGVSPYLYWEILGKQSTQQYSVGDLICE